MRISRKTNNQFTKIHWSLLGFIHGLSSNATANINYFVGTFCGRFDFCAFLESSPIVMRVKFAAYSMEKLNFKGNMSNRVEGNMDNTILVFLYASWHVFFCFDSVTIRFMVTLWNELWWKKSFLSTENTFKIKQLAMCRIKQLAMRIFSINPFINQSVLIWHLFTLATFSPITFPSFSISFQLSCVFDKANSIKAAIKANCLQLNWQ